MPLKILFSVTWFKEHLIYKLLKKFNFLKKIFPKLLMQKKQILLKKKSKIIQIVNSNLMK